MTLPGDCSPARDMSLPEDHRASDMEIALCLPCWELSENYYPGNATMESDSGQDSAIGLLHEASKYMLLGLLDDAILCTIHVKHITIPPRDLQQG